MTEATSAAWKIGTDSSMMLHYYSTVPTTNSTTVLNKINIVPLKISTVYTLKGISSGVNNPSKKSR